MSEEHTATGSTAAERTVVVTGGASGIGAATARHMAARGAHIAILDRNVTLASALAEELGPKAAAYAADILDEEAVQVIERAIADSLPPVTGLVACAGIPDIPRAIEDYPATEWERVVDSHLKGTYITCRAFGGPMAARGFGAIVNIASVLSFRSGPVLAYGPAKAAVASLTESLAVHWARRGVRVNAVAPGWTDTPFLRPPERKGERDLAPILRATPLGRLIKPEEVAAVIGFLLSPAAAIITGVTLPCDGGVIAGSGWGPYGGVPA